MELNNNAEEGRTAEARRIYANLLEQTLAQEMSIVNSLRQVRELALLGVWVRPRILTCHPHHTLMKDIVRFYEYRLSDPPMGSDEGEDDMLPDEGDGERVNGRDLSEDTTLSEREDDEEEEGEEEEKDEEEEEGEEDTHMCRPKCNFGPHEVRLSMPIASGQTPQ